METSWGSWIHLEHTEVWPQRFKCREGGNSSLLPLLGQSDLDQWALAVPGKYVVCQQRGPEAQGVAAVAVPWLHGQHIHRLQKDA